MKRILTVFLAIILCFGIVACNGNGGENNDPKVEKMSEMFLEAGKSDYKIVIPSTNNAKEQKAAEEFNFFFSEATGKTLPVITDQGLVYTQDAKYLSLGQNSLLKTSGIKVDNDYLSYDGYMIKTLGNTVFVSGSNNRYGDGTCNGVYEVLEHFLNYHYYAPKAYKLDRNVINLNMLNFDIVNVPDFEKRCLGYGVLRSDTVYADRMRVMHYGEDTEGVYNVGGHNQWELMYQYADDPDKQHWFADGSATDFEKFALCYSQTDMMHFLGELLKPMILADKDIKDGRVIMIGMPDNYAECKCDECTERKRTKTMNFGGEQVYFINYMASYLEPWLKENFPYKTFRFSFFAYHHAEEPPVVINEKTGEYEPFSEYVIPRKDVGIYWAPISQDFARPITDETGANIDARRTLDGWSFLLKDGNEGIQMWNYCENYKNYFINFPAQPLNAVAENYKYYYEHNIYYMFEQGPCAEYTSVPTMEELKIYVQGRMLWDTSLNINDLIRDFISFYYGEASDAMMKYFFTLNDYCINLMETDNSFYGGVYTDIAKKVFWPKGFVDQMDGFFQEGFNAIKGLENTDKERYQLLYDRLEKVYACIDFLNLMHYRSYYKKSENLMKLERLENAIIKYNMYQSGEGYLQKIYDNYINIWKAAI